MAWNFDNILKATVPSTKRMGFDGKDVWVSDDTGISVFGYWDSNANYEGLYGGYYPDFYDSPKLNLEATIDLSSYLSGSEVLDEIVKVGNSMYVAVILPIPDVSLPDLVPNPNAPPDFIPLIVKRWRLTSLIQIDIVSKTVVQEIVTPGTASYNITSQNNKIWFTDLASTSDTGQDKQKLYFYNTLTSSFSSGEIIPTKKQFQFRVIANGRDNWVLLGNNNSNSILKFDDSTGVFVSEVATNRDPSAIYVNGDRLALVASADGMVTEVNQATDTSANVYSTFTQASNIVDDGNFLWSSLPLLARTDKSGFVDNMRVTTGANEDFALAVDKFDDVTFTQLLITPEFAYQFWNGASFDTRIVRQYVFCLSPNHIQAFRVQALYRTNTINIRGTAMIATGVESYYGETTT